MVSSVRECICACQAGCSRDGLRLSALPQVSGALSHLLSSQDVFLLTVLILVLGGGTGGVSRLLAEQAVTPEGGTRRARQDYPIALVAMPK